MTSPQKSEKFREGETVVVSGHFEKIVRARILGPGYTNYWRVLLDSGSVWSVRERDIRKLNGLERAKEKADEK
jgi:hypothetical protein